MVFNGKVKQNNGNPYPVYNDTNNVILASLVTDLLGNAPCQHGPFVLDEPTDQGLLRVAGGNTLTRFKRKYGAARVRAGVDVSLEGCLVSIALAPDPEEQFLIISGV